MTEKEARKKIERWVDIAEKNGYHQNDSAFANTLSRIRTNCPNGVTHFCNGKVNLSQVLKSDNVLPKERCPYFKNGRCINQNINLTLVKG